MVGAIAGIAILVGMVFGMLGGWVASQKGRRTDEGAYLGFFLLAFGVLIEALLPARAARGAAGPPQ